MKDIDWNNNKNVMIALLIIILGITILLFRQANKGSDFLREGDCFEICEGRSQACLDNCFDMAEDQYEPAWPSY